MREVTTRSIRQETRESESEDECCGSRATYESCMYLRALVKYMSCEAMVTVSFGAAV
jgi:hypothetical protein